MLLVMFWGTTGFTGDNILPCLVISCVIFGLVWACFSICNREGAAQDNRKLAFPVQKVLHKCAESPPSLSFLFMP